MLLAISGRRRQLRSELFYLCPKLYWSLAEFSVQGRCSTWRAGHLDEVILFLWPKAQQRVKLLRVVTCILFYSYLLYGL